MGDLYVVTFENVAVTAAQDFFELQPADDKPIAIHAIFLSQSSDVGDAAEEMLRVKVIRGHTTTGSGGSTPTPAGLDPNAPSSPVTAAEANNTTIASAGTTVDLHAEAFNIRSGWAFIPTPECRPKANQGNTTIVVRLMAAPADSLSMSGTLIFEVL